MFDVKIVLQVVNRASVEVENKIIGEIDRGYLLLVGIFEDDTEKNAIKLADKISKLRVFPDSDGKTNLSLKDVNGSILSISQFTLCADLNGCNRPSFFKAAKKDKAIKLYELFNDELRSKGFDVETGEFGADMKVNLINEGPFTLVVEN